jgi:hypothetical protein
MCCQHWPMMVGLARRFGSKYGRRTLHSHDDAAVVETKYSLSITTEPQQLVNCWCIVANSELGSRVHGSQVQTDPVASVYRTKGLSQTRISSFFN